MLRPVLEVEDFRKKHSKTIELTNNHDFNAGMLYINTKLWCDEKVTELTLSLLGKNRYTHLDRDVLNIAGTHNINAAFTSGLKIASALHFSPQNFCIFIGDGCPSLKCLQYLRYRTGA